MKRTLLNRVWITVILICITIWNPPGNAQSFQSNTQQYKDIDAKIKNSFNHLFANLDTLTDLSARKPKVVVVEKVKYVKVYKTVPVYIPEIDTVAIEQKEPPDTLDNDYLIMPAPKLNPVEKPKKENFLKRVGKFLSKI